MKENDFNKLSYKKFKIAIAAFVIFIQSFTPFLPYNLAYAHNDTNYILGLGIKTKLYTLKFGETALSVANRFNMSLDTLEYLNRGRFFKNGFKLIGQGDRVNIPIGQFNNSLFYHTKANSIAIKPNQSETISPEAGQVVLNLVSNYVGNELERKFSYFGNASISLDLDKNFVLRNYQAELLFPLLEKEKILWFFQGALHRTENRNQSNLGTGIRYFINNSMLGANTFFDYDLSRHHSRIGFGLEYWQDYLTLNLNAYKRLTNWKNSLDIIDYQERPADGWDIRGKAYLPSHPQLGTKLIFEQYYGNEVGLFNRNKRQKDPYAVTFGVSYTPIPIITLETDYRIGKNSENDTKLGLQFNYQFGVPWKTQISANAVAQLRTLKSSHYDFVSRNKNIVLQYRKSEVLAISLPENIDGEANQILPITVKLVKAKYPLKNIEWAATEIIADGGKVEITSPTTINLTLPPYNIEDTAANKIYSISALAFDTQGNKSNKSLMLINVKPSTINVAKIKSVELVDKETTKIANGIDHFTYITSVVDNFGAPVKNVQITANANKPDVTVSMANGGKTDANGQVILTLTSSHKAVSNISVTAALNQGTPVAADSPVNFVQDTATAHVVSINSDRINYKINELAKITVQVNNYSGEPVNDTPVKFSSDENNVNFYIDPEGKNNLPNNKAQTDEKGTIIVYVTSTVKQDVVVTAKSLNPSLDENNEAVIYFL